MSEIKEIADMEFDELLEHVDLDKLDVVKSHINRQDIVLVPTDNTLSRSVMAHP